MVLQAYRAAVTVGQTILKFFGVGDLMYDIFAQLIL
jgi:hypothetical protein